VEQALTAHAGTAVKVDLVVDGGGDGGGSSRGGSGSGGGGGRIHPANVPAAVDPGSRPVGATPTTNGSLAEDTSPRAAAVPQQSPSPTEQPQHLRAVPESPVAPVTSEADAVPNGRAIAEQARSQGPAPDPDAGLQTLADTLPDDDDVDLDGLVDVPPESVKSPVDRLAEAFPGSELVDDPY
ncbi:MAG: hypothetical protein WBV89_11885, partial [Ilumatobacter sp.]